MVKRDEKSDRELDRKREKDLKHLVTLKHGKCREENQTSSE